VLAYRFAVYEDFARTERQQADQNLEKGRFPGAIRTYNGYLPSVRNLKGDLIQDDLPLIPGGYIFQVQPGR
jgi:hypothetical protein